MARAKVHSKLGYVDPDGSFHLAKVPQKEIERARAKAQRAIAPLSHRALSDLRPAEAEAVNAAYLEPFARAYLAKLEAQPKKTKVLAKKIEDARKELAYRLVMQGRFSEASEVDDHGKLMAAAAHRPDGEWCDHEAKPIDGFRQLQFNATEIVSEVHQGVVRRYVCKTCGLVNISATAPPQDAWYYGLQQFHGLTQKGDEVMLKGDR